MEELRNKLEVLDYNICELGSVKKFVLTENGRFSHPWESITPVTRVGSLITAVTSRNFVAVAVTASVTAVTGSPAARANFVFFITSSF